MTPELLGRILEHARTEAPRECCGLLIAAPDSLAEYVPCRNIAEGEDDFRIHPEDWADAEDRGHVLGVVHSHPGGPVTPSPLDLASQGSMGLPWWIVVPETSEWARFGESPAEGRVFAWGVEDCYSLVRDHFGGLPDFTRQPGFWRDRNLFMDGLSVAGFVPVQGDPEPGDGMLFAIKAEIPNHCAVYLGEGRILHHLPGRLSVAEPIGAWVHALKAVVRRVA
jgi:proteasome lid subunit RPN8/RPN11